MYLSAARIWCIAFAVLAFASCKAYGELRTWTDKSGKHSVEAELVDVDEETAHLRAANGKKIKVPLASLDSKARTYIQRWQQEKDNTARQTEQPIVGLTILVDWKGKKLPKHFFGFGIRGDSEKTFIVSSRRANQFSYDPSVVDEFLKTTQVYALDGGKLLQTAPAQFLQKAITDDRQYERDVFLLPAPAEMVLSPFKIAKQPISPNDKLLVADVTLPVKTTPKSDDAKNATVEWKECEISYFRRSSYFISRIDGGSISRAGVPVVNMEHEVVGLVQAIAVKSANAKGSHGHVVSLLDVGPKMLSDSKALSPLQKVEP